MSRVSLKDALFLGFCAVLVISCKAALRFHLKIPGHSMLLTLFFLLLARGCVRHYAAATFTGAIAGILAVILGMGKGGPLILIKFIFPALMIDAMAGLFGALLFQSMLLCAITGALAAGTRFISAYVIDTLVGMDAQIVLRHAFLQTIGNVLFGMTGTLAVPSVIRKLKAFGAIEPE